MGRGGTRLAAGILGGLLAAATLSGDEVLLVGGGKITGTVVEKTKDVVVLETAAGRISVPRRRVASIVDPSSGAETYRNRAAALDPHDVDGWAALARWAAERDLVTQSREAWKKVLVADPYHPEAKAALGNAEPDRTWNATEEAYRKQGYELFEGRWVTPAERGVVERERAAEQAREQGVRDSLEAEARTRDAEARARDAESRARDAEARADAASGPGGTDSGTTPARPSDVLGPSSGPRPTETYYTDTPTRPDPPPPSKPRAGSTSKPAQNQPPPPQGSSGGGSQKKPD